MSSSHFTYDFTNSNLVLMIGRQIFILLLVSIVLFFNADLSVSPKNLLASVTNRGPTAS
jgi:hypothetical protein